LSVITELQTLNKTIAYNLNLKKYIIVLYELVKLCKFKHCWHGFM